MRLTLFLLLLSLSVSAQYKRGDNTVTLITEATKQQIESMLTKQGFTVTTETRTLTTSFKQLQDSKYKIIVSFTPGEVSFQAIAVDTKQYVRAGGFVTFDQEFISKYPKESFIDMLKCCSAIRQELNCNMHIARK